jgi:ATP-dependent DNA ligase
MRAGERYQVHVQDGQPNLYYSRRGIEHGTYSKYDILDPVIRAQLRESGVILDGEIIVWNKARSVCPAALACRHEKLA